MTAIKIDSVKSLRVGQHGRIVLPAEFRRELHIGPGDAVVAWMEDGRLIIQSRDAVERELRQMFKDVNVSLADELIAERRAEAARDDAE